MPLVELPCLDHRQPLPVHALEHVVQCVDGPLEIGCVADVEIESLFLQDPSCLSGLLPSGIRKVHIGPSCEQVLLVPNALSVPDQNQLHGINPVSSRLI